MLENTEEKYAIIGAGPAGLCGAKNCVQMDIPFVGFEAHANVGGLWDIDSPTSTMYQSAHLISSKKTTELREFPIPDEVADYPHHSEIKTYFQRLARHFGLYEHYCFNTKVIKITPFKDTGWYVSLNYQGVEKRYLFKGVMIANGTLHEPIVPKIEGEFAGEILHSSLYKHPEIFENKRVLIVGAGNSGCDIAIDAIHRARKVDISMRRGYHFVPKYVFGKPADTIGSLLKLPYKIKQRIDAALLKIFIGNPQRLGIPKPDHLLYDSHPIVNSLVLYHLGHGDIHVKPDVLRFEGNHTIFKGNHSEEYDLVVLSTGYKLHYPFIDRKYLNWQGMAPAFFLNAFHPDFDNLFILGMVEAAGIGWQGRDDQARLVCSFICANENEDLRKTEFCRMKKQGRNDMSGGATYMELERMAYYVHKETYLNQLRRYEKELRAYLHSGT